MTDKPNGASNDNRLRLMFEALTFLLTIAAFGGMIWWRQSVLEGELREVKQAVRGLEATTTQMSIAVGRMEERTDVAEAIDNLASALRGEEAHRKRRVWYPNP